MPPFNVTINFRYGLQFKTSPPCHGPDRKGWGGGGWLISAQAAHVSLVTAGSRYGHGSAQFNDCALVAFSNPFEIHLILIYLQLPSLEVERICKFSCQRMKHTLSKPLPHHQPIQATPPWPGEVTRGTSSPLSQMVSIPPEFPDKLYQATSYFSPCASRVDHWPH